MDRFRLDWENMKPLPRRKVDGATREDLAERKFNMHKAKHKGRCHISNQKRRQIALNQSRKQRAKSKETAAVYRTFKTKVAAFWRGEIDEHP